MLCKVIVYVVVYVYVVFETKLGCASTVRFVACSVCIEIDSEYFEEFHENNEILGGSCMKY